VAREALDPAIIPTDRALPLIAGS